MRQHETEHQQQYATDAGQLCDAAQRQALVPAAAA
jgi:hypothetical protein